MITALGAPSAPASTISTYPAGSYREGRLIVGFPAGTTSLDMQQIASAHGARFLHDIGELRAAVVEVPAASVLIKQLEFESDQRVRYAEPDFIAKTALVPNDPSKPSQWSLPMIRAEEAWNTHPATFGGQGSAATGVTIAITDTGVANHEDLNDGRILPGANCVPGTCTLGNSNDDNGHGTHVAGIAAAATDNSKGIAGVAYTSRILPVKVLDSGGYGSYEGVASGIVWAAQNGARVINLSLGGSYPSTLLCDAVTSAIQSYSSLVVAASGNSGYNDLLYPAACSGAVGVGSTNETDSRSYFSSYGSHVFIAAPGSNVYSTVPTCCTELSNPSGYMNLSGTSMATPHVAGLAALVASSGIATPDALKLALAEGANKSGTISYGSDPRNLDCSVPCTWNQYYGYGRIDAANSIQYTPPQFSLSAAPVSRAIGRGQSATFTVTLARAEGFIDPVTLSTPNPPSGTTATFDQNPVTGTSSVLTVTASASTPYGTYSLIIRGTSGSSLRATTVSLTVEPPDFSLTLTPPSTQVVEGSTSTQTVNISRRGAFAGAVSFSASGIPAGSIAIFSPNPTTSDSSVLSLRTTTSTPGGTYPITITGTGGQMTRTTTAFVTVVKIDFSLSVNPWRVLVEPGGTASYPVSITRTGGHAADVDLEVEGLPVGTTAQFSPDPVSGTSSTLNIVASMSAPEGAHHLLIKGTSGSMVRSTGITLVISNRLESAPYTGLSGELLTTSCVAGVPSTGGACFGIQPWETELRLTIRDDTGMTVAGRYRIFDSSSRQLSNLTTFCRSTSWVRIPPGGAVVQIFLHTATSTLNCGSPGGATVGYVDARFR